MTEEAATGERRIYVTRSAGIWRDEKRELKKSHERIKSEMGGAHMSEMRV